MESETHDMVRLCVRRNRIQQIRQSQSTFQEHLERSTDDELLRKECTVQIFEEGHQKFECLFFLIRRATNDQSRRNLITIFREELGSVLDKLHDKVLHVYPNETIVQELACDELQYMDAVHEYPDLIPLQRRIDDLKTQFAIELNRREQVITEMKENETLLFRLLNEKVDDPLIENDRREWLFERFESWLYIILNKIKMKLIFH